MSYQFQLVQYSVVLKDHAPHQEAMTILKEAGFSFSLDLASCEVEVSFQNSCPEVRIRDIKAIAPFLRNGSFLEFKGEDERRWRFLFYDGEMHEEYATTTWVRV